MWPSGRMRSSVTGCVASNVPNVAGFVAGFDPQIDFVGRPIVGTPGVLAGVIETGSNDGPLAAGAIAEEKRDGGEPLVRRRWLPSGSKAHPHARHRRP